ncbi:MAG: hypothetical protein IKR39_06295, partial [Lachnospiraceae bacterium]|nr:hypothetical protein [Lachnospiraceae bacterium]
SNIVSLGGTEIGRYSDGTMEVRGGNFSVPLTIETNNATIKLSNLIFNGDTPTGTSVSVGGYTITKSGDDEYTVTSSGSTITSEAGYMDGSTYNNQTGMGFAYTDPTTSEAWVLFIYDGGTSVTYPQA